MTNLVKVSNNLANNQAVNMLGKNVSLYDAAGSYITGRVEACNKWRISTASNK